MCLGNMLSGENKIVSKTYAVLALKKLSFKPRAQITVNGNKKTKSEALLLGGGRNREIC